MLVLGTHLYGHEVRLHFAKLVDVDAGEEDAEDEHAERDDVAAGNQPVHRDRGTHSVSHFLFTAISRIYVRRKFRWPAPKFKGFPSSGIGQLVVRRFSLKFRDRFILCTSLCYA